MELTRQIGHLIRGRGETRSGAGLLAVPALTAEVSYIAVLFKLLAESVSWPSGSASKGTGRALRARTWQSIDIRAQPAPRNLLFASVLPSAVHCDAAAL